MSAQRDLTHFEILDFCQQWRNHLKTLEGKVPSDYLVIAFAAVQPENFGWEGGGKLRPSRDLARLDLYDMLVPCSGVPEALDVCMLSKSEELRSMEASDPAARLDAWLDMDELLSLGIDENPVRF